MIDKPIELIEADLAAGDGQSLQWDSRAFTLSRVASPDDPRFAEVYQKLWDEFGAAHEMETRDVIRRRLSWQPAFTLGNRWLRYEMILVQRQGAFVAARDHTAIVTMRAGRAHAVVHLSHVLIDPAWRRTGLAGWLRAWPIQTARACLAAAVFPATSPITLVAEMEHPGPNFPNRLRRLQSYEKAGFKKVDPTAIKYCQPDFRSPSEIDASGGPQPLPFGLVVRRVGREQETRLPGAEVRDIVQSLYSMYGTGFRERDMAVVRQGLDSYPDADTEIALVPPYPMITVYYHADFAAPIGNHLMPIGKFALVAEELKSMEQAKLAEPPPITPEDLRRVHTPEYIEAIRTGAPRALAESQKFPWSSALFPSVCLTNGGCLAAARQALRDGCAAALASGFHHAHADHGEGFCTFNGLVVAADALKAAGEVRKVAILDLDLHYGNGTASLAPARPYLTALSIYGSDYHANVAYRDVTSRRHLDGPNHLSVALPAKCDGRTLDDILERHLPSLLASGPPDLLFYQAGADPLRDDPYSPLALTQDDLRERDRKVFAFARQHSVPLAWVLAGGYTRDITKVVEVHVNTFKAAATVFDS